MKKFFLSLLKVLAAIPDVNNGAMPQVKTCRKWNNQVAWLMDEHGAKLNLFEMPAVFIAFKSGNITQLGNGVQLFEDFIFELHILKWSLDTGLGTFEDDLDIFDLKETIYLAVQKFQPGTQLDPTDPNSNFSETGACIRIREQEDNSHYGVYHFIQTYKTTWVDDTRSEPYLGIDGPVPPLPLLIQQFTKFVQDTAVVYDPTVQYLLVNATIVSNTVATVTTFYIIIADTPNPAGAFDATKWMKLEPNNYNYIPT
jgi:hypothetical protein